MNAQRLAAHIWMWGIIAVGVILAFFTIPSRNISIFQNQTVLTILASVLAIFLIYYLASIAYCYLHYSISGTGFQKMVTAGVYGRRAHPTCTLAAIGLWAALLLYPNTRVFFANVWITLMVFFWMKMEEAIYRQSKKENDPGDNDPD